MFLYILKKELPGIEKAEDETEACICIITNR